MSNSVTRLFKLTLSNGSTYYGIHSKHTKAESYKKDILSISKNNVSKKRATTEVQRVLADLSIGDISSEIVSEFTNKTEAESVKESMVLSDSKSLNRNAMHRLRNKSKVTPIRFKKSDVLVLGSDVYVQASLVPKMPVLKDKYSTHDNVDHPTKGRYFKVITPNIQVV